MQNRKIERAIELKEHILLFMQNNTTFVFPKNQIDESEELIKFLKELAKQYKFSYIEEFDWAWRK